MRVGVIGMVADAYGNSSYAYRIAAVVNHGHTAYCYPTQDLRKNDPDGMRIIYPVSILTRDQELDFVIVVQSKICIHNDTKAKLLLFKTESVEPYGTVDNADIIIKKLERMQDYQDYEHVIASAIAINKYNPNREKDILLLDVPWLPLPFDEYIERVERAQHLIVMQRYHDINTYTCRVIEAMACKTIPILFYDKPSIKKMYEEIGITEDVMYFVSIKKYGDLQIKEYDIDMAERGYKLVIEKFNMKYHVNTFMELLENG